MVGKPTKTIRFGTRDTPCGCVAWKKTDKTFREKRFRNGYASADLSAMKWIHEEINVLKECIEIDGLAKPEIYVNGVHVDL